MNNLFTFVQNPTKIPKVFRSPVYMFKLLNILLLSLVCAVSFAAQVTNRPVVSEVWRLIYNRKCSEAMPKIDAVLKENPSSAELVLARSSCRYTFGDTESALRDAFSALSLAPDNEDIYGGVDQLLFMVKRYDESIRQASERIEKGQLLFRAYEARSRAKTFLGDHAGAIRDLARAMEIDPYGKKRLNIYAVTKGIEKSTDDPRIYEYYALTYDSLMPLVRKLAEEVEKADHCTGKDIYPKTALQYIYFPILSRITTDWANLLAYRGLNERVPAVLDKMVALEPKAQAYHARSLWFKRYSRFDEQRKDEQMSYLWFAKENGKEIACLEASPQPPERLAFMLSSRGGFYLLAGDKENALKDFERAVKLNPDLKPSIDKKLEWKNKPPDN